MGLFCCYDDRLAFNRLYPTSLANLFFSWLCLSMHRKTERDVLLRREISLKVICEKSHFSNCDFCNTFFDYDWTNNLIIQKYIV